jgi:hypothetical protein
LDQKKVAQLPPLGTTLLAPNPDDPASTQHTAVGKETGETAHVERWNNTLRQRLACFVRMTLSFSKSVLMHKNCFWCKQQMGVTVR